MQSFGFKKIDQSPQYSTISPSILPPHSSTHLSGSGVSYKAPLPTSVSQVQSTINNGSLVNGGDTREKSGERLPKRGDPKTATGDLKPAQLPTNKPPYDKKNNPSLSQIVPTPPPPPSQPQYPPYTAQSQVYKSAWSNPYDPRQINLDEYPAPHPASPLSKHLNKLLPPNESIITFFNSLFQ